MTPSILDQVPELPEVESVRRQLAPEVIGRRVVDVWRDPYPSARITDVERVVGHRIDRLLRRGKFLVADLDRGCDDTSRQLVMHLGMTGSLRTGDAAAVDDDVHDRVRLLLDDGRRVTFRDPRRFGRVSVVPTGVYLPGIPTLANLGPEPLSPHFTAEVFTAGIGGGGAPLKARLLDQRRVAGVGNIYADESLWRARIHPATRRIGAARAHRLHAALVEVLAAAVEREGTTFRDYQMVNGASGRYATFLDVYGRAGLPCHRCGGVLRGSVVAQRGTTHCPTCQRH